MNLKNNQLYKIETEDNEYYFMQGDIMKCDLIKFINECSLSPQMIYTDIPWNGGNCKYWRTIAGRTDETIKSYKVQYEDFLSKLKVQLFDLSDLKIDLMFIEAGVSGYWHVEECFRNIFKYEDTFTTFYGSENITQKLLYYNNTDDYLDVSMMHDDFFIDKCFDLAGKKNIDCVFDCCVGLGTTLRKCVKYGMNGMFFDLNKDRLYKTMNILLKKGYCVESV